jgi:hypothetical protein
MSELDQHLDRLLRAAAQAPARDLPPLSYATQTRAMAAWRGVRSAAPDFSLLRAWQTGLATAFGAAIVAVGVSFAAAQDIDADVNDPYVVADPGVALAMTTGWLP